MSARDRYRFQRTRPEYFALDEVMPSELAAKLNEEPPADGSRWQLVSSWTTSQRVQGAVTWSGIGALLMRHRLVGDSPAAAEAPPRRVEVAPAPVPADTDHAAAGDPPSPESRPIEWVWLGGPRWHAVRKDASVAFCGRPVPGSPMVNADPLPFAGARGCIDCLRELGRAGGVG